VNSGDDTKRCYFVRYPEGSGESRMELSDYSGRRVKAQKGWGGSGLVLRRTKNFEIY